ncbi:MAG: hypothetical protein NTW21_21545 [Verrucomicrobia bacterium]|nr:hypothetical protein [Verrucomicrobiota bacterium]
MNRSQSCAASPHSNRHPPGNRPPSPASIPLAALSEPAAEPDWNLVKRHFRRYGNPEATAAKYGIGIREIRKYRHTRFWAVYVDGELLAVVVYRKGALAIADMLMRMRSRKEAGDAAACSGASMTTFPLREKSHFSPVGVMSELRYRLSRCR